MHALTCTTFLLFVGIVGVTDIRSRRIPNWLTVSGAAVGVLLVVPTGLEHLLQALLGFGVALSVGFLLFLLKTLGAGDAKFLGAVGVWAGLDRLPIAFLAMAGGGALFALAWSLRQKVFRGTMMSTAAMIGGVASGTGRVAPLIGGTSAGRFPYGVGLGLGAAAWWFWAGCLLP
jgi:prepilin peptidase CpaA